MGVGITEGSMTKSHYVQITFGATDAVGVDKTECSLDRKHLHSPAQVP
jgi:hypothetical protein